ncbi:MAG: EAL domain-containing protein [Clostridia bacterium]|nr:EAL domain-containing protein [Clostridia bacterium]
MNSIIFRGRRIAAVILSVVLICAFMPPFAVHADDSSSSKNVRVGWYESPFNSTDKSGRRSGYAYEYQLKIAAYSGWTYTYVSGSWPELMQMLIDGEIDLMSDVSYTEERSENMLFSELPMGTEEYCVFISPGNKDITSEDYSSLNGKRIGVNKDSVQVGFYNAWARQHNVSAELIELTVTEVDSIDMLSAGKLDAYITLNAYGDPDAMTPVFKIGSSDFYFAVNNTRPDLLDELNAAMSRIQDENPYYNQNMFEKHVKRFGSNAFLTAGEKSWLDSHGAIRVGYQDNYLAFCASDPATGGMTGALKDYLDYASDCVADTHIDFETTAYPNAAAALEALKKGEIDCVFPANFSGYDGEKLDIVLTPALMSADVYAVVRQADRDFFANKEHVIVAVNEGNPNYDAFLLDNFPNWCKVYFSDTSACLKAVSESIADCVLISSYRYNNISRLCDRYNLTPYSTATDIDYCVAVAKDQTELYSILAKVTGLVPNSAVNSALSYYITQDAKLTFGDFLIQNLGTVLAIFGVVLIIIISLLIWSLSSERKAKALISATETDDLTGLYNRDYFFEYANGMYRESPDLPRDAIVINIDHFHSINALNGREFGDRILRFLGNEVRSVALEGEGIGGRFGADRFDIYFRSAKDYRAIFRRLQKKIDDLAPNASIRLRMGVMPFQEKLEPIQLFDRARTACSAARGSITDHLIIFDEKVRERELYDQRLLNDLRRALDSFELEVHYQPKYDIRCDPPRLVSAEALIRWNHPELGMLNPEKFVPLFERNGMISEVDKYVWAQAARQIYRWREQFGITIPISFNLSLVDIFDPELEKYLDDLIIHEGLARDSLMLEVTETAYTENADYLIRVVKKLRSKGFIVEMDDFGTGYSSLSMLSSMPVDVIKMDRSFVRSIDKNKKDTQLVALIVGIAKNLNIPVIAEGVETESQLNALRKLGCYLIQGFYFSPPLHPDEFESKLLRDMRRQ